MIYVDSNVPMYLVGGEHVHQRRVLEMVPRLVAARERLVTSAETFQEILHRYLRTGDRERLAGAYEALETMVSEVVDVQKADVDAARAYSGNYPGLSSRDCLHLAVMRRIDCPNIWSYDAGFDVVRLVQRIE